MNEEGCGRETDSGARIEGAPRNLDTRNPLIDISPPSPYAFEPSPPTVSGAGERRPAQTYTSDTFLAMPVPPRLLSITGNLLCRAERPRATTHSRSRTLRDVDQDGCLSRLRRWAPPRHRDAPSRRVAGDTRAEPSVSPFVLETYQSQNHPRRSPG